ncbi:MAG: cytochrome c biogenesis heme-transporting ATPase CcmA [Oceanospirillales bacterium TMED33]|nr:heme ABC transporter ATP-binding protein CcmA [Gammaproteobacteria bacterium]RPG19684.1 MAG: cytochrome c biogenesis heme-transporting ATPase CcmA [Oceanospirillales bacterium TMED33]|tara:strand:- start:320 stop:928 length:609 start_codon:yes stop_codon:yes gene_type:complete
MIFAPVKIEISALSCERDDRLLFNNLSVALESGQILRVAGPNGAGKTTLLRTVAGLFGIQDGVIQVNQLPLQECLDQIIYIGHKPQVTKDLTVLDNLKFLTDADEACLQKALDNVGLKGYHDSLVKELSQGQGRRCALARLWCVEAPIWILDEPYTALDVGMAKTLDARINEHVAVGGICLFTTHQPPQQLDYQILELGDVD